MSKRKNRRNSPNLPQSTLDRARQQLGVEPTEVEEPVEEIEAEEPEVVEKPVAVKAEAKPAARSPRSSSSSSRPRSSTRRRTDAAPSRSSRKEQMDMSIVRNRLEHPTRVVTEEELKQEYSFVIKDLRSMFLLAAILIVGMVIFAQVTIP